MWNIINRILVTCSWPDQFPMFSKNYKKCSFTFVYLWNSTIHILNDNNQSHTTISVQIRNPKPLARPTDNTYQWNKNVHEHFRNSDAMLDLLSNINNNGFILGLSCRRIVSLDLCCVKLLLLSLSIDNQWWSNKMFHVIEQVQFFRSLE